MGEHKSSKLFSNGVMRSLAIVGATFSAGCDRKETPAGGSPPAARPEAVDNPAASLGTKLGDLIKVQAAVAKDLAAVSDAKTSAAVIGHLGGSMDQWLALAPSLETTEDPDGSLTAAANEAGKAMGANYQAALKTSEPFKNVPQVAEALEKLRARQKELLR